MKNIKQKLHAHELWLSGNGEGQRFSAYNADLRSADLRNVDLRDADLRRADLGSADLSSSDLSGAILRDANLSCAILRHANLFLADVRYGCLRSADLTHATMRQAELHNTDLAYANTTHTNLAHANGIICLGVSSHGWRFYVQATDDGPIVGAGCRRFTFAEARAHWETRHSDELRQELLARVDLAETIAKVKGW